MAAQTALTTFPAKTPSPLPPGTFENAVLGYRISLSDTYRRSRSSIFVTHPEGLLGRDTYTFRSEREEREECQKDAGHIPSASAAAYVDVEAYRNPGGLSVMEWTTTPRPAGGYVLSHHRKVEPLTIGGHEAVRLVADNVTADVQAFAIGANDRFYVVTPHVWPTPIPLGDVAKSFTAIRPGPVPTPTATTPPRDAARELAEALARAFAARDADAVARLMPSCWIAASHLIDGSPNGSGGLNRSAALFTQALRERFAGGDLTVTVDPTVQTDSEGLFVRSDWKEPDRTVRVDLFLREIDGRWQWSLARHHYRRADITGAGCIPYRSPWVSPTGRC